MFACFKSPPQSDVNRTASPKEVTYRASEIKHSSPNEVLKSIVVVEQEKLLSAVKEAEDAKALCQALQKQLSEKEAPADSHQIEVLLSEIAALKLQLESVKEQQPLADKTATTGAAASLATDNSSKDQSTAARGVTLQEQEEASARLEAMQAEVDKATLLKAELEQQVAAKEQENQQLKVKVGELLAASSAATPSKELLELHGANEQLRAAATRAGADRDALQADLEAARKLAEEHVLKEAKMAETIAALRKEVDSGADMHDEAERITETLHLEHTELRKKMGVLQGEMKVKEDMLELLEQQLTQLSDVNVEEMMIEAQRVAKSTRRQSKPSG